MKRRKKAPTRTVRTSCTPQEEIFAHKYVECGNATEAATLAKYSAKTAGAKGSELLKRPRVAELIASLTTKITEKCDVIAERVLNEMALIAFSDIRHYSIDDDGNVQLAAGAPASAMRAVKKLKRKVRWLPSGDDESPIKEVETEIELWSKDTNLVSLGRTKLLKLFADRVEIGADESLAALIVRAAQGAQPSA